MKDIVEIIKIERDAEILSFKEIAETTDVDEIKK